MKTLRRVSSLALALVLVLALSATAFAATSSVTYKRNKIDSLIFGFAPGSTYTTTDLFDNFKGVMPGDTLTEEITVSNQATTCDYIKVYMQAVPHSASNRPQIGENVAEMEDFLNQLTLTVWNKGSETPIFRAQADELDGLKEKVLLGSFKEGEGTILTVELKVPADLDNKYANREGEVDWLFTVEEYDNARPNTPKTGDDTTIAPYVLLLSAGLAGMAFLLVSKRRRNQA